MILLKKVFYNDLTFTDNKNLIFLMINKDHKYIVIINTNKICKHKVTI